MNRFDGNQFIPYYKHSSEKLRLTGNELNEVYADKEEPVIWIATQRAGLNAYNYEDDSFYSYLHDDDIPGSLITNDVTGIDQAVNGNLWISTYHQGVDLFDKSTGTFIHYNQTTIPELVSNNVWTLLDGRDGNLYIGHVAHGLSILSLKDNKVVNFMHDPQNPNSLPGNEVHCIYKDHQSNIWIGTNNGLALYNPDRKDFFVFRHVPGDPDSLPSNRVYAIREYENKLIVSTEMNGISFLDLKRPFFISLEEIRFQNSSSMNYAQQISQATVRSIFIDSFDNLWLGTYGDGVHFLAKESSVFYNWSYAPELRKGLTHKVAWGLCTDQTGQIWVGTDGGGINLFRNGERVETYTRENNKLGNNAVLTAFNDSNNRIWLGAFLGGIYYYDARADQFVPLEFTVKQGLDVRAFYEDSQKRLWVSTNKGIYVFPLQNPFNTRIYDMQNTELPDDLVRSIMMDDKGHIWVGTFGGGVAVFDEQMQLVQLLDEKNGFPSNMINQIYKDRNGNMWVATGDGLVYFPAQGFFSYTVFGRNDGINNSFIRGITEDQNGNIWFSTNNGICCYLPEGRVFYNYTHASDEIPIGNFMSNSVTTGRDGTLYFGSINGVCYFDPESVMERKEVPPVVITGLTIYDKQPVQQKSDYSLSIPENRRMVLQADENTFTVHFGIQNYALVNQVEYAYFLKGSQDTWFPVNQERSITFRDVRAGHYEFCVRARINNQDWSDNFACCYIEILPPWWASWWAKTMYIVLVLSVLVIILRSYKYRLYKQNQHELEKQQIRKERELNDEQLRFYTNITHELRTPLSLILGPLEDLVHEHSLPAESLRKVSLIHQSALHLLNLINQILEFRKTETQNKRLCVKRDDITLLVRETGLRYKELNNNPNVKVELSIPAEPYFLYYDWEMVLTILNNLLSNALKYTERGTVYLTLSSRKEDELEYTEIEVKDTGCGIAPDALEHIFDRYYQADSKHQASGTGIGLALVKNLVELHQAAIHVDSNLNEGTSFKLSLLTQNTYPDSLHANQDIAVQETTEVIAASSEILFSHKPVILIVEDNPDICSYIEDSFKDSYEVFTASNGQEGIDLAFSKIPDIIISDIMMPIVSGIELCRILKEDMRTSHIPVILLTAKDSLSDKTEGYEAGADSYLTKPFSASLLRSRVVNLLEARKKLARMVGTNEPTEGVVNEINQSLSKLDSAFLEKIISIVEENIFTEKIDVAFIADKMCMSHSTLYRKIKSLTDVSTNEFVRKIRLRKAAGLLRTGEYHVSEISYMVGFNSPKYFRQCFKEEFGVSPSEYQTQSSL